MKKFITYISPIICIILFFITASCDVPQKITARIIRGITNTQSKKLKAAPKEVAKVEDLSIPESGRTIPIRVYTPAGSGPFPILIYMHGGGWVVGNLETHDDACRFLVKNAGCVVISVDYRLAPEHKFPAAVDDVFAILEWTAENARAVNGDPARIAVAGSSAGGNLAAVVCLMAKERGGPPLVFQLLAFPATNLSSLNTDSYRQFSRGRGLKKSQVEIFRRHYLKSKKDRWNPFVSPLLAEDLSGLPSALIITGELDILRDDGEAYAKRLKLAGVPTTCIRVSGIGHASLEWGAVTQEVQDILQKAAASLYAVFADEPDQ